MAANSFPQKDAQPTTYAPENLTAHNHFSPLSPFYNVYNRFTRWRTDLDLPQPGTIENLQKEIKGIVLSVPWPSFSQL
jgi:mitochondrial import receptor subunit TOM40